MDGPSGSRRPKATRHIEPLKLKGSGKPKTLEEPKQGNSWSKGVTTKEPVSNISASPGSDSGYGSTPPQSSSSLFDFISPVEPENRMVVPAAPVNLEQCSLDVDSPFYSSDTVELFSVKDARGKDTGLLFKTIPDTMNADNKAVQKAWAEKNIANEAYVFERLPSDPRLVQFYGEHTINGRKGILLEKIQGVSLEQKFRELRTLRDTWQLDDSEYMLCNRYLIAQAGDCLRHLHDSKFVHNDCKPDNLIYDKTQNRSRLIDLGTCTQVGEVATPGHEYYVDPEAVVFKLMDSRRLRAAPSAEREKMTDEARKTLPTGAESNPVVDVYSLGQMAYIQGLSAGDKPTLFTMGVDIAGDRTSFQFRMRHQLQNMPERYKKCPVIPHPEHLYLFPKSKFAQAMKEVQRGKFLGRDYVDFINSTLSPLRKNRASLDETMKHPFLKLNSMEENQAKEILANSTGLYQTIKAARQQAEVEKWQ